MDGIGIPLSLLSVLRFSAAVLLLVSGTTTHSVSVLGLHAVTIPVTYPTSAKLYALLSLSQHSDLMLLQRCFSA